MEEFDLYLSIGIDCAAADALSNNKLRNAAYPFDWMRDYPLSTILNNIENNFEEMFSTDLEEVSFYNGQENRFSNRWIIDKKNDIVCMHHFYEDEDIEENRIAVNNLMRKRWRKLKTILNSINRLCLFSIREKESTEDFISFLTAVSNYFPHLNIELINLKSHMFWEKDRLEEEKIEINDKLSLHIYHFNNWQIIDTGEVFDWYGNREIINKILSQYKLTNPAIGEKDIFE